jgi:teichuronic acid biosynthesis glycosyltransferase TuaG
MTNEAMNNRTFVAGLVSVIVPVYNAEKFIRETLDSVLSQNYPSLEIVAVDDKSTDSSLAILNEYAAKHPNFVVHEQEQNGGAAVARNTALELAKGQYIAFIDSDDVWLPGKLEEEMKLLNETKSPLIYTALMTTDEEGNPNKKIRKVPSKATYHTLLRNTVIATSSVVLDRNVFGDFRMPLLRSGQDYATWLMLLRKGAVARGIKTPYVRYRVRKKSLSSNKFKSLEQVYSIQTKFEHINKFSASCHVIAFAWHALMKRFF